MLEDFRRMVNDCIGIGLENNLTSTKSLSMKAYHELEGYDLPSAYRLTAITKAVAILKNHRRALRKGRVKRPFAVNRMLTDCYLFRIIDGKLRISLGGRRYEFIQLNDHVLRSLQGFAVRSVSLTASALSLVFLKETIEITMTGLIGLDRNLGNVTTATLDGKTMVYDLSRATRIKAVYREVKSHFRRNDARIRKKICGKYGRKQRYRVRQRLYLVSKAIVEQAKATNNGIVMEDLTGIRKLYRKGNGQGNNYRSRLNSWSYYELQRQIEYKARWDGIPVIYVNPQRTSSNCAVCGSGISECAGRKAYCPSCKRLADRDENAALNVAKAGVRFAPLGEAVEAMVTEPSTRQSVQWIPPS